MISLTNSLEDCFLSKGQNNPGMGIHFLKALFECSIQLKKAEKISLQSAFKHEKILHSRFYIAAEGCFYFTFALMPASIGNW